MVAIASKLPAEFRNSFFNSLQQLIPYPSMPKLEPATKKPKKLTKDTLPARLQYVVDQFHGKWGDDENKAGELVANLANYQWMDDTDNLIMDAVDGILCQRFRQADSEHFMLYKTVLVAHHDITKPVPKKK